MSNTPVAPLLCEDTTDNKTKNTTENNNNNNNNNPENNKNTNENTTTKATTPLVASLQNTLNEDPVDWCARHLLYGRVGLKCDAQTAIDVAIDYMDAGVCVFLCVV